MFKHILVPLDGSHLAEAALKPAAELASKFDSKITLLRVVAPPFVISHTGSPAFADLVVAMRRQAREEAELYLKTHKGSLRQQGCVVHTQVLEGESPAEAILAVVEAQDIDGIVMSTHGRGGIARWVYGSVADKMLRHADVPVLLIRAKAGVTVPPIESEADIRSHEPTSTGMQ